MTSAALFLLLACGDQPQIIPPDPAAARQLVREALALYGVGVLNHRRDRLADAARCLEEAVRLDPESVPPRQLLVDIYQSLGRLSDATAAAAAVVILDPTCTETWRKLARLLHEMKRTGEAITVLNRCLATPSLAHRPAERIAVLRDFGRLYSEIGGHRQAADACRKALSLMTQCRTELVAAAGSAGELDRQRAELSTELAAAALAAGQFGDARDAALEARDGFRKLDDDRRSADLAPTLAAAYAGLGERAKAQSLLDKHVIARPRDVPAFALKARLLRETGDGAQAVEQIKQAVNFAPDCVPLRVLLGDECRKSGDRHLAMAAYRAATERKPDVAAYRGLLALLAGPDGDAMEILNLVDEKAKEARPARDDDNPMDDAARKKNAAAAAHVRALRTALRQEPAAAGLALAAANSQRLDGPAGETGFSYYTWLILADVAENAQQLGTAEKVLRRAVRAPGRANEAMAYSALIHILWVKLDRPAIVSLCREALKSAPNTLHSVFHYHLARALPGLGDIDGALGHAKEAVRASLDPIGTACETRIFALSYAGRFEQAESECLKLLGEAKRPADVIVVRHELARVYAAARRFDQAEEQLRLILELAPDDAAAHNSLGYELADRGRNLDEAERLVRRALELDRARKSDSLEDEGDSASYLDSLGWVLFRRGRFAEARELIDQAVNLRGGSVSPEVWDHLGDVCARMGKADEAAAAWGRARALARTERTTADDPRAAEIERKLKRIR